MEHEIIYQALLKRDAKEKSVNLLRIIDANDKLVNLVENLQTEIDYMMGLLQQKDLKLSLYERDNKSLSILLNEKDKIICKLMNTKK